MEWGEIATIIVGIVTLIVTILFGVYDRWVKWRSDRRGRWTGTRLLDAASGDDRPGVVPMPALTPFTEDDVERFSSLLPYSVDQDPVVGFCQSFLDSDDPVRLVWGPTGVGKTSLVRARLKPHLEQRMMAVEYVEAGRSLEVDIITRLDPDATGSKSALPDVVKSYCEQSMTDTLVIVDQFEQWLAENLGREFRRCELARAIKGIPNRRLRFLLIVRSDFNDAYTPFMQACNVSPAEGDTCVQVAPFSKRHAKHVMIQFGIGLGCISDSTLTVDNVDETGVGPFLDRAIGYFENEEIVPAHLRMLCEILRFKTWDSRALRDYRDTRQLAEEFVSQSFSHEPNQEYRELGGQILEFLTRAPAQSSSTEARIKRDAIEVTALRDAILKEPSDRSMRRRFKRTLDFLCHDVKLVTTDASHSDRRYRLSHDLLVGGVQSWRQRNLEDSKSGRAYLTLRRHAELGQTLSFWNLARVEFLCRERRINADERKLLQRSRKRATALLMVFAVLTVSFWALWRRSVTNDYVTQVLEQPHLSMTSTVASRFEGGQRWLRLINRSTILREFESRLHDESLEDIRLYLAMPAYLRSSSRMDEFGASVSARINRIQWSDVTHVGELLAVPGVRQHLISMLGTDSNGDLQRTPEERDDVRLKAACLLGLHGDVSSDEWRDILNDDGHYGLQRRILLAAGRHIRGSNSDRDHILRGLRRQLGISRDTPDSEPNCGVDLLVELALDENLDALVRLVVGDFLLRVGSASDVLEYLQAIDDVALMKDQLAAYVQISPTNRRGLAEAIKDEIVPTKSDGPDSLVESNRQLLQLLLGDESAVVAALVRNHYDLSEVDDNALSGSQDKIGAIPKELPEIARGGSTELRSRLIVRLGQVLEPVELIDLVKAHLVEAHNDVEVRAALVCAYAVSLDNRNLAIPDRDLNYLAGLVANGEQGTDDPELLAAVRSACQGMRAGRDFDQLKNEHGDAKDLTDYLSDVERMNQHLTGEPAVDRSNQSVDAAIEARIAAYRALDDTITVGLKDSRSIESDSTWHRNSVGMVMVRLPPRDRTGPGLVTISTADADSSDCVTGEQEITDGENGRSESKSRGKRQRRRHYGRVAMAPFWISQTEVTNSQFWQFLAHENLQNYWALEARKAMLPPTAPGIRKVDWYLAANFCNWLSHREGLDNAYTIDGFMDDEKGRRSYPNGITIVGRSNGYRLPTTQEFEYAARGGSSEFWPCGNSPDLIPMYARYFNNSGQSIWPVATRLPNQYGLFDMYGNAFEWCHNVLGRGPSEQDECNCWETHDPSREFTVTDDCCMVITGGSIWMSDRHVWSGFDYIRGPGEHFRGLIGLRVVRPVLPSEIPETAPEQ